MVFIVVNWACWPLYKNGGHIVFALSVPLVYSVHEVRDTPSWCGMDSRRFYVFWPSYEGCCAEFFTV